MLEAVDVDSTDTGIFDFSIVLPPSGLNAEVVQNSIDNATVFYSAGSFFATGVYLHSGNEEATDTFTFTAHDGEDAATFNGTVTAAITGINDHPYISSEEINLTIHEDNGTQNLVNPTSGLQEPPPVAFALSVSATDTDSDTMTWVLKQNRPMVLLRFRIPPVPVTRQIQELVIPLTLTMFRVPIIQEERHLEQIPSSLKLPMGKYRTRLLLM